jgi:exportin-T
MLRAITGCVPCFMLYVGANDLEEVLGTLVQGAIAFPDPMVQKLCFGVLRRLIEVWAREGVMPGFVEYMYKNILPACFHAPLKPTFNLDDGNTFIVRKCT